MRALVCAIVAAIGLAAHPAFAQADRTAAAFWKTVQAACDATAAKPPSELGRRIAQTAIDEFTRFGGHQIDSNGRLFRFGLTEAEHKEDDGGDRRATPRPSRLVAGDEILAGAVWQRHRGQARGARLSRRLDLDGRGGGRGAPADRCRPAPARRRGCVRSGGARNPARGGHPRGNHRYPVVGGLHQLRDTAVGRRGERVPVRQRPSRLYLRRFRGERSRADQRGRRPALSCVSGLHNQTSRGRSDLLSARARARRRQRRSGARAHPGGARRRHRRALGPAHPLRRGRAISMRRRARCTPSAATSIRLSPPRS